MWVSHLSRCDDWRRHRKVKGDTLLPEHHLRRMDFLHAVEGDLRSLSVEARKKHPVVKEAAERGILKLRSVKGGEFGVKVSKFNNTHLPRALREEYASKMTVESVPNRSIFQSQDLLRPFLLACNHTDAGTKLITLTMISIQRLINYDAISPLDIPNVMRVLMIQAEPDQMEVQLKILQTTLLLLTNRSYEVS